MPNPPSNPAELATRLRSDDAGVRRIAIMDLCKAGEPGLVFLLAHLEQERDEKALLLIIRRLAAARHQPARPALARLRDDPATPIRIYHAAILAHDSLEHAAANPHA